MKKVVVLSIALIVLALSASQVMAQPPAGQGGPGQGGPGGQGGFGRGMMMGGDMYDQLNLTEEQKKKMEEMRTEFTKKLESATPETRREIFTEMRDKMQSVLTDEQKKKMEELRTQRGNRGFGGFGGPEGTPGQGMGPRASVFPFQRFLDQLKLTDEQKTKVATMQREAIEKLFNDIRTKVLTEDQRKELEKLRAAQPAAPVAPAATKPAEKPAATEKPAAEQPARGQRRARQQ
ncbi:MAG: hypothetical protein GX455_09205 [Phycisphaerae bacterium]|nr:hypothetical protein [Phycisphaerae bacterium]